MNKKQGDQIQFYPEKRLGKRKKIHLLLSAHYSRRCIVLSNRVMDSLILQEIFHLSQSIYHAAEKKHGSLDEMKRMFKAITDSKSLIQNQNKLKKLMAWFCRHTLFCDNFYL